LPYVVDSAAIGCLLVFECLAAGKCVNGAACIFDHPVGKGKGGGKGGAPITVPPTRGPGADPKDGGDGKPADADDPEKKDGDKKPGEEDKPAETPVEVTYNEEGLPVRPGQQMCGWFLRTGVCTFGPTCRFNHPSGLGGLMAGGGGIGEFNPLLIGDRGTNMFQCSMPRRPGQQACTFMERTGKCPFGAECRFDHPPPPVASTIGGGDAAQTALARIKPTEPKKKEVGFGGTRGRRPPPRQGRL
jgi:hypothetical protein